MTGNRKLTSREAFNRVLWDARLNRAAFRIGYIDRVAGAVREQPLDAWSGAIPWHRVVHIRCGAAIVWARDAPEDSLAGGLLPPEAWVEAQANRGGHPGG
jgi:uncharacterized protein (UPF0248 family)